VYAVLCEELAREDQATRAPADDDVPDDDDEG
jgi:hypothetical protein